ncbi:hypothetical protein MCAP1_002288 [Malassezia caprae]|uniref:Homeobox domain-containing protein n=1 Tax=Malassezia caprae TaxID=1381934 RepID=A0AAF0E874_9BASI|nr:hypothetical protein MCAP1_002288 [Malassezia caprae]
MADRGEPMLSATAPLPSGASAPREKKRRRRTRPHEVDILMSAYVQNAFPNEKTRDRLASMVGMTPRAVSVWFQNRRQAEKKRSLRYNAHACVPPTAMGTLRAEPHTLQRSQSTTAAPPTLPLPPREPFRRVSSTPCVSLMTTSGGRAALGEAEMDPAAHAEKLPCALASTREGHCIIAGGPCHDERAIWQRMESSSALGSGTSDADDMQQAPAGDEDDEECTLRRLAQKRLMRLQMRQRALSANEVKRPETDARLVMQERVGLRRTESMKRKPSLSLELAADRDVFADKENMAPTTLKPADNVVSRSLPDTAHYYTQGPVRMTAPMRRSLSATHTKPSGIHWARTSSTRSDVNTKEDVHDDSGFFDETDRSPSHSPQGAPGSMSAFTEHDRQAVELLLGLGAARCPS